MSLFLYELLYGILYFKGNDSQVIVTLTCKLTIIEGLNSLLVPPSLKDTNIVGKPLKCIIIGYFTVGERVRFLFTSFATRQSKTA